MVAIDGDMRVGGGVVPRWLARYGRAAGRDPAMPLPSDSAPIPAPPCADWRWRAPMWTERAPCCDLLDVPNGASPGGGLSLFHDDPAAEVGFGMSATGNRPTSYLRLHCRSFAGTFLSIAQDLPEQLARGCAPCHILGVSAPFGSETPQTAYLRLNLASGPNVDALVRRVDPASETGPVEFDLVTLSGDSARPDRIWVDLIFEAPLCSNVTVFDITAYRRRRLPF